MEISALLKYIAFSNFINVYLAISDFYASVIQSNNCEIQAELIITGRCATWFNYNKLTQITENLQLKN